MGSKDKGDLSSKIKELESRMLSQRMSPTELGPPRTRPGMITCATALLTYLVTLTVRWAQVSGT